MQLFRLLFASARHFMRPSVFPRTSLENAVFVPNIACNRPLEGWLLDFFLFFFSRKTCTFEFEKNMCRKRIRVISSPHNTRISGSFVRYCVWRISAYLENFKEYARAFYCRYLTCLPQNPVPRNKNVKLPTRNDVNLTYSAFRVTSRCLVMRKVQIPHTRIIHLYEFCEQTTRCGGDGPGGRRLDPLLKGRLRSIAGLFKYVLIFNTRGV